METATTTFVGGLKKH